MYRKLTLIPFTMAVSLMFALPVLAAAPSVGLVVEGDSVPAAALRFTRAQVEASYGEPQWCQSVEQAGDFAFCSFPVEGGGQVDVRYRGADGGNAANAPDDVAYNIRWHEQVSGWTTTAGVNTTLAASDPQAVVEAYPDAEVTYNQFGDLYLVVDHEQGIEVKWSLDFYTGTTHVSMAIFFPRTPPPPEEQLTRVTDLDLTAVKKKGQRTVIALVRVQNDDGLAAGGATVLATWVDPDGATQAVQDLTSSSGYAYFEIKNASRGTYTLIIDDVVLDDHRFDRENSILSASIKVK